MEYFADRNLGAKIFPEILREAGIVVHTHNEHFVHHAADADWIPVVAQHGWVILTSDAAIRRNPLERAAVLNSRAAILVLVGANAKVAELADNFVNTRSRIEAFLAQESVPIMAKVFRPNPTSQVAEGKPGRVERVHL
ncbi:MAG TPA: hypothetical protein VF625_18845 [Longimicrobium sp.]